MNLGQKPLVLASALIALMCGAPAWAQGQDGKISGVVRDTTGAGVPGVTVTATNQEGSRSETTTTAMDGSYSLPLPPGGRAYGTRMTLPVVRRCSRSSWAWAASARS